MVYRFRRGLIGIGVLIILIATLLVAAAASVLLLSTTVNLQTKSLETRLETEQSVINGVEVVSIMATDGSEGADLEHFEMVMRLQSGSDTIGLVNNTLIVFTTPTGSQSLKYNDTMGNTDALAAGTGDYTVEWLKTASDYETGYLKRGDLIKVRWNHHDVTRTSTTGGIGEEERGKVKVIPHFGQVTQIEFSVPKHLHNTRVQVYPREVRI